MEEREEAALRWCDNPTFRDNLRVQGSPRRVMERHALHCNGLFLLEKIPWRKKEKKRHEAGVMEHFHSNGLPVLRCIKNREGSYFSEVNGHLWMMREYAIGTELPRPDFIEHGWRGEALADFLIDMHAISNDIEGEEFSLKRFIDGQRRRIARRYPDMDEALQPVYEYLGDFMDDYDDIPTAFNHGDFHPTNIIWSDNGIKAVIDWEFMGPKPELYDAANMVGCAGMEDPAAFKMDFVSSFLRKLRKSGVFSDISWNYFHPLVVALRFAWLNDWLIFRDRDMVELEVTYMNLLVENDVFSI